MAEESARFDFTAGFSHQTFLQTRHTRGGRKNEARLRHQEVDTKTLFFEIA
jgi:hypothetical protein